MLVNQLRNGAVAMAQKPNSTFVRPTDLTGSAASAGLRACGVCGLAGLRFAVRPEPCRRQRGFGRSPNEVCATRRADRFCERRRRPLFDRRTGGATVEPWRSATGQNRAAANTVPRRYAPQRTTRRKTRSAERRAARSAERADGRANPARSWIIPRPLNSDRQWLNTSTR